MSPRRRTKLEKYRQEKAAAANVGTFQGLNVADDDYFILIEVEDLKYQLEVSKSPKNFKLWKILLFPS